jgi:multidrug resistance efflux pump
MNAAVHDKAVREDQLQATGMHSSPIEVNPSIRQTSEFERQIASPPAKARSRRRGDASRTVRHLLRKLATVALAAIAVLVALVTWDQYNAGPWTRDGRVRVQVASVAPEISGKITELRIVDNQFVHKGDVLYVIDPFDFDVALRANKAVLQQRTADLNVKELQSERRRRLSDLASSTEEKQVYEGNALQAKAALDSAQQQVRQAEINLERTEVRSPVSGIVTNLLLREGDYAQVPRTFRSSIRIAIGSTAISRRQSWPGCAWGAAPRRN